MDKDNEDNIDPLDTFFGVPTVIETEEEPSHPIATIQSELQEDFADARTNIKEAVELAQVAMNDVARMAKQMASPRAYETLAKLLSSVVMSNKQLVEMHKNKQDVDDPEGNNAHITHNHNTIVMTTAEMQARIEEARDNLKSE